jgi:hypothetical protein
MTKSQKPEQGLCGPDGERCSPPTRRGRSRAAGWKPGLMKSRPHLPPPHGKAATRKNLLAATNQEV